jgi:4-hydroxybenzoate polyprenyltransferase
MSLYLKIISARIHIGLLFFILILSNVKESFGIVKPAGFLVAFIFATSYLYFSFLDKMNEFVEENPIRKLGKYKFSRKILLNLMTCIVLIYPFIIFHRRIEFAALAAIVASIHYLYNHDLLRVRLKKIYLVKNMSIALIWALSIALIPAFFKVEMDPKILESFPLAFLMILAVEILLDVPNIKDDKKHGIKTIPNIKGIKFTKYVEYGIIALISGALFLSHNSYYAQLLPFGLLVCTWFANEKRSKTYYHSIYLIGFVLELLLIIFDVD